MIDRVGKSGHESEFDWEWSDDEDGWFYSELYTRTNSSSGTYAYSASGSTDSETESGNYEGGNGTQTQTGNDFSRYLSETFNTTEDIVETTTELDWTRNVVTNTDGTTSATGRASGDWSMSTRFDSASGSSSSPYYWFTRTDWSVSGSGGQTWDTYDSTLEWASERNELTDLTPEGETEFTFTSSSTLTNNVAGSSVSTSISGSGWTQTTGYSGGPPTTSNGGTPLTTYTGSPQTYGETINQPGFRSTNYTHPDTWGFTHVAANFGTPPAGDDSIPGEDAVTGPIGQIYTADAGSLFGFDPGAVNQAAGQIAVSAIPAQGNIGAAQDVVVTGSIAVIVFPSPVCISAMPPSNIAIPPRI